MSNIKLKIEWKKLLCTIWGDLYIKSNLSWETHLYDKWNWFPNREIL